MNRPWMPLYVTDYLGDTSHLTTLEHGAYLLLIMHYWVNDSLPDDDAKLARITRLQMDEWLQVRETVADFFVDTWRHKRIDEEIAKVIDISEKRKKARARVGKSQSSPPPEGAPTSVGQVSDKSATSVPQKSPHSHSHSHPHSHQEKEDDVDVFELAAAQISEGAVVPFPAPAASGYAIEEGAIRLTQKDLDLWVAAFPHVNVRGELLANSDYITRESEKAGKNWFQVAKGLLNKRERIAATEAADRKARIETEVKTASRPRGSRI